MSEHLALLYSDGSLGVLRPGAAIEQAERDRAFSDDGERDPAHMTKIARVEVTVLEIIDAPIADADQACLHCGKPHRQETPQ